MGIGECCRARASTSCATTTFSHTNRKHKIAGATPLQHFKLARSKPLSTRSRALSQDQASTYSQSSCVKATKMSQSSEPKRQKIFYLPRKVPSVSSTRPSAAGQRKLSQNPDAISKRKERQAKKMGTVPQAKQPRQLSQHPMAIRSRNYRKAKRMAAEAQAKRQKLALYVKQGRKQEAEYQALLVRFTIMLSI